MDDEVGVAAVGCRGMRVVTHGQAEVTDGILAWTLEHVFAGAHGLDDGEREVGEPDRIRLAPPDEELLEGLGIWVRRQPIAEVGGNGLDAVPALGRADDAPDAGELLRLEEARGYAVRRDHEVLDEVLGVVS